MKNKNTILKERMASIANILSEKLNEEGFANKNPKIGITNEQVQIRIVFDKSIAYKLEQNEFFSNLKGLPNMGMINKINCHTRFVFNSNYALENYKGIKESIQNYSKSKIGHAKFNL